MVSRSSVEEMVRVAQNLYLAITIDKRAGQIVLLASDEGGEDIEKRAEDGAGQIERLALRLEGRRCRAISKA